MTNLEDDLGIAIAMGVERHKTIVEEQETYASEFGKAGNKRCLEGLAWFAGAATTAFLTVYNAVETHQLEHLPPDKVTAAGGLIGLALAAGGVKKLKQGVELSNISARLDYTAGGGRAFISYLEQNVD